MDELRVPKSKVSVHVLLCDGTVRNVTVFLADSTSARDFGGERISELFNRGEDFVPAVDDADGTVSFLNREEVLVVWCHADSVPQVEEDPGAVEHRVEVHLASGRVLEGRFVYSMPTERARVNDYLNSAPRFIQMIESDGRVALINKRRIAHVSPGRGE